MRIKSIKTINDGRGGLKVDHVISVMKNNEEWDVFRNDKYTHPISVELEGSLKRLKIHLLKLVKAWGERWDSCIEFKTWELITSGEAEKENIMEHYLQARNALDDLVVTGITSDGEHFVIKGKTKSFDNANVNYVTGCVHPTTDYPYYEDAINIVQEAYDETTRYIKDKNVLVPRVEEEPVEAAEVVVSKEESSAIDKRVTATNGDDVEEMIAAGAPVSDDVVFPFEQE